jgi:hypothetical protein
MRKFTQIYTVNWRIAMPNKLLSYPSIVRPYCLIMGGSHANCLRFAASQSSEQDFDVDFAVPIYGSATFAGSLVMKNRIEQDILNPIIITKLNEHLKLSKGEPFWVVSNFLGNHANRISLIKTDEVFDFLNLDSNEHSFSENVELLPYHLVKEIMSRMIEPLEELFVQLNKKKLSGIIHVEGPPPVWDEQHIEAHLLDAQKKLALQRMNSKGDQIIDFEINPFNFRKKMWRIQCEITQEICERNNVKYLSPPNHLFNEQGGLIEKALKDSVHANSWYGKQILAQISDEITRGLNNEI